MFANRFTALIDACSLAGALKRNLLLSLAEAGFYRVRWSTAILDEAERAIKRILSDKGELHAIKHAKTARERMEVAFADALVAEFEGLIPSCVGLPDPKDQHVLAAALKTQAAMIVTENLRDFPATILKPYNLEAKSADMFIADTLSLDMGRGVAAIRTMRHRLNRPKFTAEDLLLKMEADGFAETVDVLREHVLSL